MEVEEKKNLTIRTYNILGGGAGFLVNEEDLNFVPLSRARATQCWMGLANKITYWSWSLGGVAVNFPARHFWKMVQIEKDGELGKDLIKRYIADLELENLKNLTSVT
jgi:hypothetical protein